MALWSMGANQSSVGTLKNRALINLCLATGQIGRPGAGPLSLTGQPNAMGGRETGGLAHLLPGYRKVVEATDRAAMEAHWGVPAGRISANPGLPAVALFEALEAGTVKAVWIMATNPLVSLPDAQRARAALERAELVVVQDPHHPTETSSLAHAVLPAAAWPEKEGTMTSSERRVGLVRRALAAARGGAPGLGDRRRARREARVRRGLRLAGRGRRLRRVRRLHRRPPLRPDRRLARASAPGGRPAVALPGGRGRRSAPRHAEAVRRPALPDSRRPRPVRGDAPRRPRRDARHRVPAAADDRPRRRPVAHDDAHRALARAARGGRRAAARLPSARRACRRHRRRRPGADRLAPGRVAPRGDLGRDAPARRRVRAFPLGRASTPRPARAH